MGGLHGPPRKRLVIVLAWIALLWAVTALALFLFGAWPFDEEDREPEKTKPPVELGSADYCAPSASRSSSTLRNAATCSLRSRSNAPAFR